MPTAFKLSPDARSDLVEIRRHTVEHWGATQARKYLLELRKTMRLLAETPSLGKLRTEVGANVLSFPHGSHVIYCVMHGQLLVVFAVLHKRMVPSNHLAERDVV